MSYTEEEKAYDEGYKDGYRDGVESANAARQAHSIARRQIENLEREVKILNDKLSNH